MSNLGADTSRRSARTSYACTSCHRRKRKCDGQSPCSACQSRKLPCQYNLEMDQRRRLAKSLKRRQDREHDIENAASMVTQSARRGSSLLSTTPQWSRVIPGSLSFGLAIGEHGELEYRGPTSSAVGARLPAAPHRQINIAEMPATLRVLPDAEEMCHHLDLFMEWQNSCVLILPGCSIDSFMDAYPPSTEDVARRVVLWSILSLTYNMHGIGRLNYEDRVDRSDSAHAEAAQLVMDLALRKPSVEAVQSACLLACREYSCGHENSAWVFHGIATTVGGSIGLHAGRDYNRWVASGHLSPRRVEIRVVTYWALVLVDRMLGSCLGRNCLLHPTDFSTAEIKSRVLAISTNKRDTTLVEGSPTYTNSVLNVFRCAVDLWKLTDETLSQIYIWQHDLIRLRRDTRRLGVILNKLSDVVKNAHAKYHAWKCSLPLELSFTQGGPLPHLLLLHMAYHSHQILVHRPFLFLLHLSDNRDDIPSRSQDIAVSAPLICRDSAFEIMNLCKTYRQHYTLQCIVFIVAHFLLNACTIHIIDRDNTQSETSRGANVALDDCLAILEEMATVWGIAGNAIALVNELKSTHDSRERDNSAKSSENTAAMEFEDAETGAKAVGQAVFDSWDLFPHSQDVWSLALLEPSVSQMDVL